MKNFWLLFVSVFSFLFFSCASATFNSTGWKNVTALEELYGTWRSSRGEYTYPLEIDGKKYMRYALLETDDTIKWKEFAKNNDIDMADLWQRRFSLASSIYSTNEYAEVLPSSDENGTQKGRKFFITETDGEEKVFSRIEILIPENLVAINLNFFMVRNDGFGLREQKVFHLASQKFPDIEADDTLYYKMGGSKTSEKTLK